MNPRNLISTLKQVVRQRVTSVPSWVIVLATAAVVGSVSAMASVVGLARLRNRSKGALEVPVREAGSGGSDE